MTDTYGQVQTIIDNAAALASDKITESDSYLATAVEAANAYDLTSLTAVIESITLPVVPSLDSSQDFDALFTARTNSMWADIDTRVQGYMNTWMSQYIPKLDSQIQPMSDAWLEGVLGGTTLGIPKAVENQIWDRGRARDTLDSVRLEQEVLDSYAAKGFGLPPGAAASKLMRLQTENSLKSAAYNREVAIKQMEFTLDLSKQAIQATTQLRLGVAQAFADFLRAAIAIPGVALQSANGVINAKEALWRMIAAYIQGKVAVTNLDLQRKISQGEINVKLDDIFVRNLQTKYRTIADTAVSAAQTVARIAEAAIGSQQTLANVTYQTDNQIVGGTG